ncbi:hypothetical protein BKA70DRAFT_1339563 [Coprinopsis sp. MPI-PUGE-AT-0042]|nr:hypothetical protein BKA70DRAFT_1339563 [Coprinopsis sp. MPI-PUGE-AT-0042]
MSSYRPPALPKLSQSLLNEVSAGSGVALFNFLQKFKEEHYNLKVLEAILSALQSRPNSLSLTKSELALRGLQSLECLQKILAASLAYPDLLEATRSRMRAGVDDVLAWVDSTIQSCYLNVTATPSTPEHHLVTIADSIVACLSLKGAVLDDLIQHPILSRTLLGLWSAAHSKDPHKIISGVSSTGTSPILAAFNMVVCHKAGFQAIAGLLTENPRQLKLFCKASRDRFMQIPFYVNNTTFPFDINGAKSNLFFDTLDITTAMINNAVIRRALFRAEYLGFLTATIVKLASVFVLEISLNLAAGVFDQCNVEGSNPIHNLRTILNHGYVTLASDVLLLSNLDIPGLISNALHIISSLEAYTCYPRVVTSLWNAINREPLERMLALQSLPSVGLHWNHLVTATKGRIAELEIIDAPVVFCDNSQHHDWQLRTTPMSCSGCHLAIYCSSKCQREDWKSRHRRECNSMRLTYLDRYMSGVHLSQKMRAFPLKCLEVLIKNSGDVVGKHLGSLRGEKIVVVAIVNFRNSTLEAFHHFNTVPLKKYLAYHSSGDSAQMGIRLEMMLKDFVLNPSADIFLFEVRLAWTRERAIYMIAEVDMSHGSCKIKRSLVQVVRVAPGVPDSLFPAVSPYYGCN